LPSASISTSSSVPHRSLSGLFSIALPLVPTILIAFAI
jgi:hypothetical protein